MYGQCEFYDNKLDAYYARVKEEINFVEEPYMACWPDESEEDPNRAIRESVLDGILKQMKPMKGNILQDILKQINIEELKELSDDEKELNELIEMTQETEINTFDIDNGKEWNAKHSDISSIFTQIEGQQPLKKISDNEENVDIDNGRELCDLQKFEGLNELKELKEEKKIDGLQFYNKNDLQFYSQRYVFFVQEENKIDGNYNKKELQFYISKKICSFCSRINCPLINGICRECSKYS